ncbi:LemA family protein [Rubrivivax gelatinosus]|uniref:LemA family protein n=1 Tax=Rubrivivax gelatinosus TaxID=28068 RepID=A0ABS1DYZ9_RUBGE|nr:LemA family protein [Rubrivivax gelatinosus]
MSWAQILVLAVAAVIVFWMVGAYNRLVALRAAIGAAWLIVAEALARRGAAARVLAEALRAPMADEARALDALLAAQAQVQEAAEALAVRPVRLDATLALVKGEAAMGAAASRVLALLDQQPLLKAEPAIAEQAALLGDSASRLAFARQLFNDAGAAYDEAAAQFPTRLLLRLYRFEPAGRL